MLHIFLPVRRYHLYKNCRPSDLYDTEMLKYSDKIPANLQRIVLTWKILVATPNSILRFPIQHGSHKNGYKEFWQKWSSVSRRKSWSHFLFSFRKRKLCLFSSEFLSFFLISWLDLICIKFFNDLTNRRITWIETEKFLPRAAVISISVVTGQWDIVACKMIWQQTKGFSLSLSAESNQVSQVQYRQCCPCTVWAPV